MENINKNIQKIKEEGARLTREVREKTLNLIITSFGLIAGLAWNEAIQSLINHLFSLNKNSVAAKFIYAFFMTLALVFITIYMTRIFKTEAEKK